MKFLTRGNKLYSILCNKCPRCHMGNFWTYANPLRNIFNKKNKENLSCANCSLLFEVEIGFWYGAMYVSYAIGVAIMLIFWGISTIIFNDTYVFYQISFVICLILISAPFNYHYSRLIWINIFVDYKKELS